MERLGYISKVVDKLSVEITESDKDLNILIDLRKVRALFRDYFDV